MNSTSDQERVKALKAEIESLEMEITDAVVASLFSSIESCWDHFPENNHATLLLQVIANVVHHVDILRTRGNVRAQSLLRSLVVAFENVAGDKLREEEKLEITAHEVKQVLDWQQECLEMAIEKQSTTGETVADGNGLRALQTLFEQEMVKTRNFIKDELTSIKGLLKNMVLMGPGDSGHDARLSDIISEHVKGLQDVLQEEMSKLRRMDEDKEQDR